MPNYAELERNKVLAVYPSAVLEAQARNWMRHSIGPNRFALDCAIGSYHHLNGGVWQDTITDLVNSDLAGYAHMVNVAPFIVHCKADGSRRLYPRRDVLTEYIEFGRVQWWTGSIWQNVALPNLTRSGETLTGEAANFALAIRVMPDQVEVKVTLKTSVAARPLRWAVSLVGLTVDWPNRQLVSQGDGAIVAVLPEPRIVADGTGFLQAPRPVTASYSGGFLRFDADLTGLVFPITIDPTLDLQVGAGADDGTINHDGGYDNTEFTLTIGQEFTGDQWIRDIWLRFTNVTIAQGATIDVAYFQIQHNSTQTAAILTNIYMNDADDAAAPVSNADYIAKALTSGVAWDTGSTQWNADTWISSPSIITPVQAVVNRAGWVSGNDMMVLWKDDGTPPNTARNCFAYDFDTTKAAKFHLEYTAGGAAAPAVYRLPRYGRLLGVGR